MKPNSTDIEVLVRSYLTRDASTVDARAMLERVREQVCQPIPQPSAPSPNRWRGFRRVLLTGLAAAALLLAFLGGRVVGPSQASAESLLRDARQVHTLPLDRCYLVQTVPEPGTSLLRYPRLAQPRETRLWTREDRFFVRSTDERRLWVWGRDESGKIWIALGKQSGMRFESEEIPPEMSTVCDLISLRVDHLLDEVLARFTLEREYPSSRAETGTYRIRATLPPNEPIRKLRSAVVELDAETRVIRRLVLHRTAQTGEPLATVTFTLVDTTPQADSSYTLEGNLDENAKVFSRTQRVARAALMWKFFGIRIASRN